MVTVTVKLKKHIAHYLVKNYGNPVRLPLKTNLRYSFLAAIQKRFEPHYDNQVKVLSAPIEFHLNEKDLRQHGVAVTPSLVFYVNGLFEDHLKNQMFLTINLLHFQRGMTITDAIRTWQRLEGFNEELFPFATIHRAYYDMRKLSIKISKNAHNAA